MRLTAQSSCHMVGWPRPRRAESATLIDAAHGPRSVEFNCPPAVVTERGGGHGGWGMSGDDRTVSRRTLLRTVGLTAATGALAVSGVLSGGAASGGASSGDRLLTVRPVTAPEWAAVRGPRYHVAHRGSGDVLPEHSMPAYQAAVDWGAACLEISVGITSDGVLICMHDPTYDRTTTRRECRCSRTSCAPSAARWCWLSRRRCRRPTRR